MAAAIKEISLPSTLIAILQAVGITPETLKAHFAAALWQWVHDHSNDPIWTVKFWIISKTFRYSDLFPVFEKILGADPATVASSYSTPPMGLPPK